MQINEYILNIKELTKDFIKENLGELIDFDVMSLPEERGIFFIYKKDSNELEYIGSADDANSNIKDTLSEYLKPEFTQLEFRNKVMHRIYNSINWVENEIGEEVKNVEQINKTIEYIKEHYQIRVIIFPSDIEIKNIKLIKKACISLENPNLND
ncbi:hypothetical protein [Clostridium intestinale]|uniref:GIY-YIG domain-containing protein n=2 Tax=Clostridium intestinale TaxID=36845 RepID=U2PYU1_9CLOT|nr:hypothetical protein [Clostridium intestinale]ERK31650.1 hypothetical protein CINTURNW_1063 [Clostridium intestinale URNW]QLY78638.1 hypothetical protein HZF06_16315 [Clostridium intestinale]